MDSIRSQEELIAFCQAAKEAPYVTIDTEFLRENTYYAELCLVQMAFPGHKNVAVIDVLAKEIDLAPVMEIFEDTQIVKVFHAARQDLEIFYHDYGVLPQPFFDTQIAAMVAGYGDQVGYETLVRAIAKGKIDKTSRFTDWKRRPLTQAQLLYAKADVTYLRDIYEALRDELSANGRMAWVEEELNALIDPALYDVPVEEVWKRVRTRSNAPKFLAHVRELGIFREGYARKNNLARSRVFKDDALLEAAAQRPANPQALRKLRLWKGGAKPEIVEGVINAIARVEQIPAEDYPRPEKPNQVVDVPESLVDLLRVLLKAQAERNQVAQRLICSVSELEAFASDPDAPSPLNQGWRYDVFGQDAKALARGEAALMADGKYVKLVRLNEL